MQKKHFYQSHNIQELTSLKIDEMMIKETYNCPKWVNINSCFLSVTQNVRGHDLREGKSIHWCTI